MKVRIYTLNQSDPYTQKIIDVCEQHRYDFETVKPTTNDLRHGVIPDDITPHVFVFDDGFMQYIGRVNDFYRYVQHKENINV